MTEYMPKETLLEKMRSGHAELAALLLPLSEKQLTTPGVNSSWSIKDNLAHLNAWQERVVKRAHALQRGEKLTHVPPVGTSDDEINAYFYDQNKDRSLDEVRNALDTSYQQLLDIVQSMTSEELNRPQPELDGNPFWTSIASNTYEHYAEHAQTIQHWLAHNA